MADSPLKQLLKDSKATGQSIPEVPVTSPSVVSEQDPFLLDFELLGGNRIALPYSSLLFLSINPSNDLVAMFATHTVRIKGVFLRPIYDGVVHKSVGTLKAVGDRPKSLPEGVPVVHAIDVVERPE